MIYRILKATEENPINGDFVITCKKYLETLRFKITFKEIENLTKLQFRKILKERIRNEAFEFLKNQQLNQEKIKNIKYEELKIQDYLADGDRNNSVSKIIFKARGKTLDIKSQKRWKYDDLQCTGCSQNIESGEEMMQCENLGSNQFGAEYSWFFSDLVSKKIEAGKVIMKKLQKRKKLREEIT